MAIIYFGSPSLAVPPFEALIQAGFDVAAVVTQPDARRGRGGKKSPSAVKAAALKAGVKSIEPRSMKDEAFLSELRSYRPEFLVVAAYGKILPPEVLSIPSVAAVNLHASKLPMYRGAAPINWAIIHGLKETGITTMFMSEGLDEGDILLCEDIAISEEDTAQSLGMKMAGAGGALLVRTLSGLRDGSVKPVPQVALEGMHTYARQLSKEDGQLDWELSAWEICNRVRGMYPWPGAFCYISGRKLKVLAARPDEGCGAGESGKPGQIVEAGERLIVACGGGCVELLEVQPEGKRAMAAGDYLRGHEIGAGAVFE
ncbi:MAG: methionyl-tRNA formyltransferase [Thermodesulfovibrionales bacterium]|nr:methionyl-tRNA formyltransferase [Thermodesulfovibrionales bacterium]